MESASLIPLVGDRFVSDSAPVVPLVNLELLLFPTTLMGASLPLLVADSVYRSRNVGVSVARLYFTNMLGAAFACQVIGFVWFNNFGLRAAIDLARTTELGPRPSPGRQSMPGATNECLEEKKPANRRAFCAPYRAYS